MGNSTGKEAKSPEIKLKKTDAQANTSIPASKEQKQTPASNSGQELVVNFKFPSSLTKLYNNCYLAIQTHIIALNFLRYSQIPSNKIEYAIIQHMAAELT